MNESPTLHVIQGGPSPLVVIGSVDIFVGDDSTNPQFSIDVRLVEEDTWQVLSADSSARVIDEHPIRLMTGLIDQKPLSVGDVLANGSRWQAVTMDFDQQPVCRADWLTLTLEHVLQKVEEKGAHSISLPLLGVNHGDISCDISVALFIDAIKAFRFSSACRIWLVVPVDCLAMVKQRLLAAAWPAYLTRLRDI